MTRRFDYRPLAMLVLSAVGAATAFGQGVGDRAGVAQAAPAPRIPGGSLPGEAADAAGAEGEPAEGGEDAAALASVPDFGTRLKQGGALMIPLGICSLAVFGLAVERLISLRRSRVIPRPFVRRFMEKVDEGQLSYDEALEICDQFDCPTADVFMAAVKRWGRPTVEVEQAVMDAGQRATDGLRKFLRLFNAVSNVAPLLGLLGTVLGMIEAFQTMATDPGAGGADLLASGISQALITTAAGLAVAIPAYLAYMFFSARADMLLAEIDRHSQTIIEGISAEGLENRPGRSRSRGRKAA